MEKHKHPLVTILKYFFLYIAVALIAVPLLIYALAFAVENLIGDNGVSWVDVMDNKILDEVVLIVTNFIVILLFVKKKYANLNGLCRPFETVRRYKQVFGWAVLLELSALLPVNILVASLNLTDYIDITSSDPLGLLGILGVCLFAPLAEELVMRGSIEEKLLQGKYHPAAAILLSSFLFAIVHGQPSLIVNAFLGGLLTGWVYYRTRNILVCFIMHLTCNAFSCLYDYLQPGNPISEFAYETRMIFVALFCLIWMVFSITKLQRWTAEMPQ